MKRLLAHKTPCRSCPFLKTSEPGYFGGPPENTAEMYKALAHGEAGVRCHTAEIAGADHHCVGSLQHANATFKRYRSSDQQYAQDRVGKNPNVLGFDFLEHHGVKRENIWDDLHPTVVEEGEP